MLRKAIAVLSLGSIATLGLSCVVRPTNAVGARPSFEIEHHVARGRPAADIVAACGEGGLTDHGRARLLRQPYLQNVTGQSASVLWTSKAAEATMDVTRPNRAVVAHVPAAVDGSARPASGRQLFASVGGLEPGEIYCYTLRDERGLLTRPTGFRTAPPPGEGSTLRFVVFGDSGDGSHGQYDVLRQLGTVPFDLAVVTGDVAYGSGKLKELEEYYFGVYKELIRSVPIVPVAGNHDYGTDNAGPFREVFHLPDNGGPEGRERWYSFDYGDVHFVALDTEVMGSEQAAWLERDLSKTARRWTVVYTHKPPYSSGMHGSELEFRERFGPILEKHRVPLVLAGHEHDYERTRPIAGVTYVVTGGGGRTPRGVGFSAFTAVSEAILHFVHITVEPQKMTLVAIDDAGREFDSVAIQR